jgi:acyl carrier protein
MDEVGEIWVAGGSVTAGYWGRPADTEVMFGARLADGRRAFLRTGDLGFMRDGELFVTGRLKDLIVIRGRNYYPQDLEITAGRAHVALRPGGGIAFAGDDGRAERLVIVHEVAADHPTTLAAAIAAIRDAVVREHGIRPHTIALIPPHALPKTSSGKVRRAACRAALATGDLPVLRSWREDPNAAAPPRLAPSSNAADLSAWLTCTIAEIRNLSPDEIGPDDALSGFGVDSAEAAQLAAELETRLGRSIPLSLVIEHSTIRSLAAAVCEEPA